MGNALRECLAELLEHMENLNSTFPDTEEFLRRRGLENVRDLNERERKELFEFLETRYKKLLN